MNTILLITKSVKKFTTLSSIEYSAIFAADKHGLDPVKANVFDMIQKHPDCWICGCVTGYPEDSFTEADWQNFHDHGIGKRFPM